MARLIALLMLLLGPVAAHAAGVRLQSDVYVERSDIAPSGARTMVLEAADTLKSGDRIVYLVRYRGAGNGTIKPFFVDNRLPATVAFQAADANDAQVSVDGGRRWGRLNALRVKDDSRWRSARPEDVTHIRWIVDPAKPPGASGTVSFRGIVR